MEGHTLIKPLRCCIDCNIELIPGVNWQLSRVARKEYRCGRCVRKRARPHDRKRLGVVPVFGFVYIGIRGVLHVPVKIGRTMNPLQRQSSLASGNPDGFHIVHLFKTLDYSRSEMLAHDAFEKARGEGEWFKVSVAEAYAVLKSMPHLEECHVEGIGLVGLGSAPEREVWDRYPDCGE
jgi:hypothetical protein